MDSRQSSFVFVPKAVREFWILAAALTALCAGVMFFNSHVLHYGYPYNLPFVRSLFWEQDFLCFRERFNYLHTLELLRVIPGQETWVYPAPMVLLYKAFYMLGANSLQLFLLITGALCLLLVAMLGHSMIREGVRPPIVWIFLTFCLVTSYPFWIEFLLANLEICVFLMLAFAIVALLLGHDYLAAGLIGFAGAVQLYPLIYLGLLLSRRKYWPILFGVSFAAMLTFVSLWIIFPSVPVAFRGIQANLGVYRENYMLRYHLVQTGFDHSLYGLFKRATHLHFHEDIPSATLTAYMALSCVVGLLLYFLRIRHLPLMNQILSLCVASILLPPTSHDYTLVHLYVPFGLLVIYAIQLAKQKKVDFDLRPIFFCFAILFSTESEFIYHQGRVGGQIKAITLVVLLVLALRRPFPRLDDTKGLANTVRLGSAY